MSSKTPKTILERIRVNNILAILLVTTYSAMWALAVYLAFNGKATEAVLTLLGSSAMTVLVTLVIQFYFRKPQTESPT